uniref:ZW10 interacting kinetochore protein n=1 Tax=Rhinolophus ferrumequinum TaxID=59479 RepID=A0A671DMB1_RHIFE
MESAENEIEAAALEALAKLADVLESIGPQEEAELPAPILAEFVMDSRKKDRLLCSQLQVVDFLQNFLAQEDTAQGLDPLASEDTSRQKLKATYQEHVEAITSALTQALPKMQEAQRKRAQLQDALEQLQAKKQVAMEKLRTAQKQWQLQQEKRLQHLAEVSAEGKLLFPEAEAELPQEQDLPEDKPQELNTGDSIGASKFSSTKFTQCCTTISPIHLQNFCVFPN